MEITLGVKQMCLCYYSSYMIINIQGWVGLDVVTCLRSIFQLRKLLPASVLQLSPVEAFKNIMPLTKYLQW